MLPKIQDYGVIGDCRSAALVSRFGSIDWLCWPRFDSPSIFAAILDRDKGGHWSIRPTRDFKSSWRYINDTNVLEITFTSSQGTARLIDLMSVASEQFNRANLRPDHELVRRVMCVEGEIELEIYFEPRCNYGREGVTVRERPFGVQIDVGRGAYMLRSTVPILNRGDRVEAVIRLRESEVADFSLAYAEEAPAALSALRDELSQSIERSVRWWQGWVARSRYRGPYKDAVDRSALVLKLLTYAPSGAIIAAATTSLPEVVGRGENWDYRYCWLRDASQTMRALVELGYLDEAESFLTWLLHATARTQPELKVLYQVFGEPAPRERGIPCLCGYRNSRPARVGNAARNQFQLDVYGEVIEAAAYFASSGESLDRTTRKVLIDLGRYVAKHWDQPDEGIWELRAERKSHTHSRLLCWTALDRLLKLAKDWQVSGLPVEWFSEQRDRIARQIHERAWCERLQSYVGVLDEERLDASVLRIPWYGFEPGNSERVKLTLRRIENELGAGNGLIYRYSPAGEGAFGICGYWAVECLLLGAGSFADAEARFRQLLRFRNDLGLCAEEIDPETGDALGNFPQAYTHIGLIAAAVSLEQRRAGRVQAPTQKNGGVTAA